MKLMTKEILKRIPKLYAQEDLGKDAVVHVKFFTPWSNWTWYATEYDPETGMFFGLVDGLEREFGYFTLEQLQSVTGPAGLKIERDIYFTPKKISELQVH